MEALFTSLDGGPALRQCIVRSIERAAVMAESHAVALHSMTFAFTDSAIAEALIAAATTRPGLAISLLADWSQRIPDRGQQVSRLAALQLPNLQIRYSIDQPYVWDAVAGHMRWSYQASRGLLHHKTLGTFVDGSPHQLICGSYNWTATAARSYEHLLILNNEHAASLALMERMESEFAALWCNGRSSLSSPEATAHYNAILQTFLRDPSTPPEAIVGLDEGAGAAAFALQPSSLKSDSTPGSAGAGEEKPSAAIAFAWRGLQPGSGPGSASEQNRGQRLVLRQPAGHARLVPFTMSNLALSCIYRALPGQTLRLAMYGLSPRVPEYGALLDAARRGVRVKIILDRLVGSKIAERLLAVAQREELNLHVRTAGRMMHQKYLVHLESATVVTGTANMSTDASSRHAEHRLQISGCATLAARFASDFEVIWTRLTGSAAGG